ncbi:MAG: trypsin-like peptidase domain-containing protein [Planctomycetota bacterium]
MTKLAITMLLASGTLAFGQTTKPSTKPSTQPADFEEAAEEAREGVADAAVTGGGGVFVEATPQRVVDVTQKVFPAVVRLDVAQEVYRQGKRTFQRGTGSGVIFSPEGYILTNYHVAGRAAEIKITLANKERVNARLIGDDHWTDLAVVQLDMDEIREKGIEFPYAELGESGSLIYGQDVIAIGTPFGLARTLTMGVVSNTERTFYPTEQDIDGYETGNFSNWIQMDTPIAPGNSGGPLVDLSSKVVGINTRGFPGQNLNFAIPMETARRVKDAILNTVEFEDDGTIKTRGKVIRADLGMTLKPLQDLEDFYDIDVNEGVLISSVDNGSPAKEAGVRVSDILLELNGQPTNVRFPEQLAAARRMVAQLPIGEIVKAKLLRDGEELELEMPVVRLESRIGEERELKQWGASVRDVTRVYANQRRLNDDSGVVITSTRSGFAADKAEMQNGDVIRSINGQPATDLETFMALYDKSVEEKQEQVLLQIQRGRGLSRALLRIEYDDDAEEEVDALKEAVEAEAENPLDAE